ncbi:hypothetical protein N9E34_05070 [Opitutales bacterium]|nr:hypothetical protein [Opitutales bacterium]
MNRELNSEYKQRVSIWRDDVMDLGYQRSRGRYDRRKGCTASGDSNQS